MLTQAEDRDAKLECLNQRDGGVTEKLNNSL